MISMETGNDNFYDFFGLYDSIRDELEQCADIINDSSACPIIGDYYFPMTNSKCETIVDRVKGSSNQSSRSVSTPSKANAAQSPQMDQIAASVQTLGVNSISGRLDEETLRRFFLIMDISKKSIYREGKATQKDEDYASEGNESGKAQPRKSDK